MGSVPYNPPIGRKNTTYIPLIVLANWVIISHQTHLLREPVGNSKAVVFSSEALEAVQKNPRLLTIPDFEYQRTNPSLESWQFYRKRILGIFCKKQVILGGSGWCTIPRKK